jgi:hypothetical protein
VERSDYLAKRSVGDCGWIDSYSDALSSKNVP